MEKTMENTTRDCLRVLFWNSILPRKKEIFFATFGLNINNMSQPIKDGTHHGTCRKICKQRKRRMYKPVQLNCNKKENQTFMVAWHNSEPFIACKVEDIPADKCVCETCNLPFPRGVISFIPYDIFLSHTECWKYPKRVF